MYNRLLQQSCDHVDNLKALDICMSIKRKMTLYRVKIYLVKDKIKTCWREKQSRSTDQEGNEYNYTFRRSVHVIVTHLSHSCQEALWVEEACHPKTVGSSLKNPRVELPVTLQQLCEPKSQCGRSPGGLHTDIDTHIGRKLAEQNHS